MINMTPSPLIPLIAGMSLIKLATALPQLPSRTALPSAVVSSFAEASDSASGIATSESAPESSNIPATEKTSGGISDAELIGYGAAGIVGLIVITVAILMYRRRLRNKKTKLVAEGKGSRQRDDEESDDEDEKGRESFDSINLESNHAGRGTAQPHRGDRPSGSRGSRRDRRVGERVASSPISNSEEERSPIRRPHSRSNSGVASGHASQARANRKAARNSRSEAASDEDSDDSYVERRPRER